MERKQLQSAAATYTYLRGLMSLPLGLLLIVAALGNWEWGPLRHAWVFVACLCAAGLAWLAITRYYHHHFGRVTPSARQQTRVAVATGIGVALMIGGSLLLRSRAGWSLDLPVNSTAVTIALFMLVLYASALGLLAHHLAVWGALLVAGLVPLWGDVSLSDTSNIGLVLGGVAVLAAAVFDHRLLVRTFGPADRFGLEDDGVRA